MRRLFLPLLAAMLLSSVGMAQTPPYTDNFDSYTLNGFIAAQNGDWWTTWSNLPGSNEDGQVSNAYSNSPTQAILLDEVNAASDLILKLGDQVSGSYELKWMMYVENGKCGYFNIQKTMVPGTQWAYEAYLRTNGDGELYAGSQTAIPFSYPKATWFEVKNLIDLDADNIKLFVNGVLIHEWPFSYQASTPSGLKQLGAVNFYAGAVQNSGELPVYYIDDISYTPQMTVLLEDNMEAYALNGYLAVQNPTWYTTWSNAPGTGEDALIKDTYSHSTSKSALVDETGGATDLVLKLGDKDAGRYELGWWMYVENDKCGYYNIQKEETPGVEYGCEIYFRANGDGQLYTGSATPIAFTYPKATWFEIKHDIDITNDLVKLYLDGTLIHEWPLTNTSSATGGMKKLGGIDFFAGAAQSSGESPKYYFDDVHYYELSQPVYPSLTVNPDAINQTLALDQILTVPVSLINSGDGKLEYSTSILYNNKGLKSANSTTQSITLSSSGQALSPEDVTLSYVQGDITTSIGWTNGGTMYGAARFPGSMINQYVGMTISSIPCRVNGAHISSKIIIYGNGSSDVPGPVLYEQEFTADTSSWTLVTLNEPVSILGGGGDIWIAYAVEHEAGQFPIALDEGPANPNGDFYSSGGSWNHFAAGGYDKNICIQAILTGTPVTQWLSLSPASGIVNAGETGTLNATLNSTGLEYGVYEATIKMATNDPNNPSINIPVTLGLYTGIEEGSVNQVAVYPNPASNVLNVAASNIQEVRVMNLAGQVMLRTAASQINVTELPAGTYLIQVTTDNGTANMKFNKK